jgi:DNA mismatch repair ATPase MutL
MLLEKWYKRPASVVKELLENAVAKASDIKLIIKMLEKH